MSWATCYSGSNNIHFDFPPIMNDGRNFANWQPGSFINEKIRKEENIISNSDYRKYLVNNADKITKLNQLNACQQCSSCSINYNNKTHKSNNPYLFKSTLDNSMPFGYENSDLKNVYLSRHQLQSRMVAPILSQEQYLQNNHFNQN